MIQFLLAAPRSGSGKTTMTCALLMALKRRGCAPCAFKSGPDYIDPMFHRAVLGVESRSLDLFFSAPETVRTLYARGAAGHGAAVCEGAMGFYDGLGGVSDRASAWHLADTLGLPVLLVVEPKGQSLTLAAELKGLVNFRTPSRIAGILLNNCTARMHALLAPMLEKETGLPVLGFLPKLPEAVIGSRHLGLYTAAEVENLQQKLALLADAAEEHIDWPRLLALCEKEPPALPVQPETPPARVRIAVAQDEAFCFTYAETLEAFRDAGAEVVFFSPLRDTALPENIGGLYLPGGYPELHARELSENTSLLREIKRKIEFGLPTVAECGGFLYLGQSLTDAEGQSWPMAGVLPGEAKDAGRLVRFGYAALSAESDSMLFRAGESFPIHEFHHWDSTVNGTALAAKKPVGGAAWRCGFVNEHFYAGFPHLYWEGTPLPQRFAAAAENYRRDHD
ncbi:MAG: cobyrinate a,c-diamide synthase [Faecalibacterium prausnitzii]|nr:cobyrinate a,c-diamide synthase [Faecalibacterium prausnitzii]